MSDINFYKADGTKTTLDVVVDDFKANVKFTSDDLVNSEYIQLDNFTRSDGSFASMIVITLFARLSGKLDNENRLPVSVGFENFVDAIVTPREAGPAATDYLKYENVIPFKNAESVTTKFKLLSGELPPGLSFLEEITGVNIDIDGFVSDSADVFENSWSINNNTEFNFDQESIFNTKVEFLDVQPTTNLSVGQMILTEAFGSRPIESVDTYVENSITKTKIQVSYVTGTLDAPDTLEYTKNQVYDSRGFLTQEKNSNFLATLRIGKDVYTYRDTALITDTSNIQDQIYKDYNFVLGMFNGDTDSLLTQESFSIRVHQNFDAVRDDFLRTRFLPGNKSYFPYLDTISSFKMPLLKADGTSTFILMEGGKLTVGEGSVLSDNGFLPLILEDGSSSNITLQSA